MIDFGRMQRIPRTQGPLTRKNKTGIDRWEDAAFQKGFDLLPEGVGKRYWMSGRPVRARTADLADSIGPL